MKSSTAYVLALSSLGNAIPVPQFGGLPSFSFPSFPLPTGFPGGLPTGFPGLPTALPTGFPGLPTGLPTGFPGLPTALPTGLPTAASEQEKRQLGGLPGFSLPSFPMPTGGLGGLPSLPGGGGLPSLPGGGGLPSLPGGGGLPSLGGGGGLPSLPGLGGGLPSIPGIGGKKVKRQFGGLPGFSLPSFPMPTGGFGGGLPGFSGLPGLPGAQPTAVPVPDPGNTGLPTAVTSVVVTPGAPEATNAPAPAPTGNCTPQSENGGMSENGIKDENCCTDMTVVFARGTSETGNMGIIAGPPMVKALRQKLGAGKVTVQGVDYPASIGGNVGLGSSGGPEMAKQVKAVLARCPSTKVIVSGYSQGAMVVHNAMGSQGITSGQVAGAVLFGDPLISTSVSNIDKSKVKEFCASADTVCLRPTGDVSGSHLSYGSAADAAATFAIQAAGL